MSKFGGLSPAQFIRSAETVVKKEADKTAYTIRLSTEASDRLDELSKAIRPKASRSDVVEAAISVLALLDKNTIAEKLNNVKTL